MAEEDKRADLGGEGSEKDRFPVGIRVLAVDDDPVCLKILDNLLRRCHYNVTTTDQAIIALNLLRENKDKYDLIISDVNMPDMDGFKLLELVGLEMDLPVIMLSAYSDTELVRKGIMHGACDYLLKPVRIEEIKNIWQHVLRRRKLDSNDLNRSLSEEKNNDGSVGNGQEAASTGNADQNGKRNMKRKVNKDEDNKEESEESGDENEDPATRKKPRLQWTSELHAKFFAAVNQLGYDKAVPKKILELMNVESLTRANVASHLQKFRHYLQKVSNDVQQPNTSFRSKDSSYLGKGSLDGFGDYSSLPATGRFSNTVLSPHPGSTLGRLNSSANSRGMTSYGLIQPIQSLSNFNTPGKLHPLVLPANQSTNLFQVIPGFLEHSESRSKYTNHTGDFHHNNGLTAFTVSSGFTDAGGTVGGPCNTVAINSNNPLILQANSSQSQSSVAFGTQFPGRVHTSGFSSSQDSFLNNNLTGILSSTSTCIANESFSFPSSRALKAATLGKSTGDLQCHSRLNVNAIDNNHNQSNTFDAINTLASANVGLGSLSNSMEQSHTEAEKYGLDKMEQTQPQDGLQKSNYYSLDDVTNSILTQDPNDIMSMMDEDFSFDPYSLGSFL